MICNATECRFQVRVNKRTKIKKKMKANSAIAKLYFCEDTEVVTLIYINFLTFPVFEIYVLPILKYNSLLISDICVYLQMSFWFCKNMEAEN